MSLRKTDYFAFSSYCPALMADFVFRSCNSAITKYFVILLHHPAIKIYFLFSDCLPAIKMFLLFPLRTSLYDKRDYFNFHITNFLFLSSNIPSSPAYGVFISQLIRYARACSSYECFILRTARLSSKLLGQGYVMERLKSSLRKFYGRYGDLIKHYEVSLSQMLHDILGHDHIQ